MFGKTWKWAGKFRKTEKNIGVAPEHIAAQLRNLLEDTRTKLKHKVEPIEEIATKFHHRLVSIHPFANGNGRHARLITDLFLAGNGLEPFTWSGGDLVHAGELRDRYLAALRVADRGDYSLLFDFVSSGK